MAGLRIKLTVVANDARSRTVIKAKRKAVSWGNFLEENFAILKFCYQGR